MCGDHFVRSSPQRFGVAHPRLLRRRQRRCGTEVAKLGVHPVIIVTRVGWSDDLENDVSYRPTERIHDRGPRRLALELIVQRQDTHRETVIAWRLPRQPRRPITQSPENDRVHRWMRENRRQERTILLRDTRVANRHV